MKKTQTFPFGMPHVYALGGGITAALLFSLARQGTLPAMLLANLAPLPLMIATLAYGALCGFGSAILAAFAVIALTLAQISRELWLESLPAFGINGLIFLIGLGLPAWGLSVAATLTRTSGQAFWRPSSGPFKKGSAGFFLPLSGIVSLAVLVAASIVAVTTIFVTLRHRNFEEAVNSAVEQLSPLTENLIGHQIELPGGLEIPDIARVLVLAAAPAMAASIFLMFMLNLWLAARVVQVSGRLPRPWPDIPSTLGVPRIFAVFFALAVLGGFGGGLPGMLSATFATALGTAFALQGLAVAHDLSRGQSFRTPMLFGIYLVIALLMPWPLAIFALVGLGEAVFKLRGRRAAAVSKPLSKL